MTSVSRDLLSLHRLTVQAPGTAARLILHYGSPESALKHFDVRLTPTRPSIASAIQNRNSTEHNRWLEQDLSWLEHPDHFAISEGDAAYPSLLTEIPDPPLLLFGQGDSACLDADQLSLVGSRRASPVGISLANQFAAELAALGFVITSGLALGIDAAAHRGALTIGGLTIAVQAVGAGGVYPRRHERLAQDIAHSGCLMTEYPVGFQPRPYSFPQRNRIITGLSRGTLVVEAAESSGSVVSARLALEQNREVFAVPGSVLSKHNEGCHRLIRQGAKLVANIADVLEEFSDFEVRLYKRRRELTTQEKSVVKVLSSGPCHADQIHELSQIPIHELMALLMHMEIQGDIVNEAGGYRINKM